MSSSTLPEPRDTRFPGLRLMMLATLLALAAALWYVVSHLERGDQGVAWYPAAAPCELHRSSCQALLGNSRRLSLAADAPRGIRALDLLPLTVTLEGVEATAVHVDFVGRDMDMGLHRFPLDAQDNGRYEGMAQVPICTESTMPWLANVVVETGDGRLGSRFDFTVERRVP
ncbi:hypothetical protein DU490_14435 [Halomonas sp. DQ26W]|uniref:hypothetical protein n=1 Tax=Halomonas sp. DQ26W TaxID=2282311 RepID=UPI000DF77EBD|nr:hypothetical protein [Halomonas sp. DQ26W]RDB42203.1 hypothetical protein DU490_14435 [Halomonas sp. DQ26W]